MATSGYGLLAVRETSTPDYPKPRLLDRVHWIKRYIFFHGKRHPAEMGATEASAATCHGWTTSFAPSGPSTCPSC